MATSLNMKFLAAGGKSVSMTYPYADSSAGDAQVKTLMQAIVTNSAVFAEPPVSIDSAEFVSRTTIPVDLS